MGYPTQKPVALLERILAASSKPGQLILDPFCGCGTTIEAAQRLQRQWIGIDVTHHAIDVIEGRLDERCPKAEYKVNGRPENVSEARDRASRDPHEFQWWANWLDVGVFVCLAQPTRRMRQDAAGSGMVGTAQGRFQRIQIATIEELLAGKRPDLPQAIETDAFRHSLRPVRPTRIEARSEQIAFKFELKGGKRAEKETHWSGKVLARLAAGG